MEEECVLCRESITNPICPDCLANEMAEWVFARAKIVELVKDEAKLTKSFNHGITKCIKCNKAFSVCTYCFTENVLDSITAKAPELVSEYLTFFNFRQILA